MTNMRPKLLLYNSSVTEYLRRLKAPELDTKDEQVNIVALVIGEGEESEKYLNGFIFSQKKEAQNFYEGINYALAFQLYR